MIRMMIRSIFDYRVSSHGGVGLISDKSPVCTR